LKNQNDLNLNNQFPTPYLGPARRDFAVAGL
jgi:hypothetical protein